MSSISCPRGPTWTLSIRSLAAEGFMERGIDKGLEGFRPERLSAALSIYDALRTEVTLGQYLDVLLAHGERPSEEDALRVDRYKTASYTVQRPIQLGLALAGSPAGSLAAVPAYAVPAGI